MFFFFLISDLYFLITALIAQIFYRIAEIVIPIGVPTKETKAEMETHPVILEDKISVQYNLINLLVLFAHQFILNNLNNFHF